MSHEKRYQNCPRIAVSAPFSRQLAAGALVGLQKAVVQEQGPATSHFSHSFLSQMFTSLCVHANYAANADASDVEYTVQVQFPMRSISPRFDPLEHHSRNCTLSLLLPCWQSVPSLPHSAPEGASIPFFVNVFRSEICDVIFLPLSLLRPTRLSVTCCRGQKLVVAVIRRI